MSRIVLGVIIGLSIWSAIMLVISAILMFAFVSLASSMFENFVDEVRSPSISDTELSEDCQDALNNGDLQKLAECASEGQVPPS